MSELNLNDPVEEIVRDAQVITVEIDETLSVSGEAADAAAVGAALALKADASAITEIDVNGESADNQGHIIVYGTDIKMSSTDDTTLKAGIEAAAAKNATQIPMSSAAGAAKISEEISGIETTVGGHTTAITALQGKTAETILLETGSEKTVKAAIEERVKTVNGYSPDSSGAVTVQSVPAADNLNSTLNQNNVGQFIFRTTGGSASVNSGNAWLNSIKGERTHTGYTPQSVSMVVNGDGIDATIDEDDFIAEMSSASGTMTFSYTSSWSADPSEYGITVTGSPSNGDSIVVTYVKEVRGTITQSDPQSFVATGWNLYNNATGYAKVKKYSDEYGFCVSGSYTELKWSATLTGDKSAITVNNGRFSILADGYIWVTGGDATTTQIWMTWEDWTAQANGGTFAAYSETVIDISTLMGTRFPYGLMRAGSVQDEINFAAGKAYSRIERQSYSAENLAAAKSSGREFEYDENYIYIARASQAVYDITIDNACTANDHGEEYFTGTDVGPTATIVYGTNLVNKLERDTLTISAQTLTDAQKGQARTNIGAMKDDMPLFIEKEYSFTRSSAINANAGSNIYASSMGCETPEGYTPIAFSYWDSSTSNVVIYAAFVRGNDNGVMFKIRNVSGTSQSNVTFRCGIIYASTKNYTAPAT